MLEYIELGWDYHYSLPVGILNQTFFERISVYLLVKRNLNSWLVFRGSQISRIAFIVTIYLKTLKSFHANSSRGPLLIISNSFYFLPMCRHEWNTKSYESLGQNSNYFRSYGYLNLWAWPVFSISFAHNGFPGFCKYL